MRLGGWGEPLANSVNPSGFGYDVEDVGWVGGCASSLGMSIGLDWHCLGTYVGLSTGFEKGRVSFECSGVFKYASSGWEVGIMSSQCWLGMVGVRECCICHLWSSWGCVGFRTGAGKPAVLMPRVLGVWVR